MSNRPLMTFDTLTGGATFAPPVALLAWVRNLLGGLKLKQIGGEVAQLLRIHSLQLIADFHASMLPHREPR